MSVKVAMMMPYSAVFFIRIVSLVINTEKDKEGTTSEDRERQRALSQWQTSTFLTMGSFNLKRSPGDPFSFIL